MKQLLPLLLICLLTAPAWAQSQNTDHSSHPPAPTALAAADMTDGEVRKVDKAAKKITLKHGAIKNLDMPGMTMAFQVQNPALLDRVKAGDKVKFTAANINGALVVIDLQPVR